MANWNTGHNHFPADVGVQCGREASKSVSAGAYADYPVTFPRAFYAAPIVVVGLETESAAGAFGKCVVAVTGTVTETGFTARVYNGDTSPRSPRVNWIAVGTPK
nr:MAG TPA: H-type lectin domain [Caudoviricetes sp.]